MEDNKNNKGAPSTDNTSALFVSARKKQLAQQEEERLAAEKEAARLAAEEEVRRLELEVEERRRKAQEDAMRVEEEAQERRKLAEQERLQQEKDAKARAAQYPAPTAYNAPAVQNAPMQAPAMQSASATGGAASAKSSVNDIVQKVTALAQDIIQDKKKLGIAIGAAVGLLVLIILLSALGGGGAPSYETGFVNAGEPELGYFNLYDDGTADGVSIMGDEFEGTWVGGGGALAIYVNDIEFAIYNVIDDYTYEDALTGAYYYYYPSIQPVEE